MKKLLLPVLLLATVAAHSQTSNKQSFQKGQKLEVITETKSDNSSQMMGQSMETKLISTVVQVFDVEEVKNGSAVIEHTVKNIKFNTEGGMGQNLSYDSDKEEDRNGEIGKAMESTLKKKYKMTVDANGIVTSVEHEGIAAPQEEGLATMITAQMNINTSSPKQGELVMLKVLTKNPSKGESWTDSTSSESGKKKVMYSVKDITDSEIILDISEESNLKTTQEIMGSEATITGNTKGSGQIVLDKRTGLLKQKTMVIEGEQNMEIQGMVIPSTTKTTVTTTVK